jgi:hypothetical protein
MATRIVYRADSDDFGDGKVLTPRGDHTDTMNPRLRPGIKYAQIASMCGKVGNLARTIGITRRISIYTNLRSTRMTSFILETLI